MLNNSIRILDFDESIIKQKKLLSLDELFLFLKLIKENLDIVGLDITGDYAPLKVKGAVRRIALFLDHPKGVKAAQLPESVVTATNEDTNLKILKVLA